MVGIGVNVFRFFQLLWCLFFLFFTAMLVYDLFRIPISVNSSHEYAPERTLWEKMSPEEEARLTQFQSHCRHVYRSYNGHYAHYCPMCRKKLVEGAVPLTGYV